MLEKWIKNDCPKVNPTEIRNGIALYEKTLPVPSKQIEKNIFCSEKRKRFRVCRNGNIVEIDKPTYSDEHDRQVRDENYDFLDCFIPQYEFKYKEQGDLNTKLIDYKQLSNINAYLFLNEGLLFVIRENLYFLSGTDRIFYGIGNVGAGVYKIQFDGKGNIVFYYISQYKAIIQNQRYERSGQDFTGYIDKYEITEKINVLTKEKFDKYFTKAKANSMRNKSLGSLEPKSVKSNIKSNHADNNLCGKNIKCEFCGSLIATTSKFCDQCGKKIEYKTEKENSHPQNMTPTEKEISEIRIDTKLNYWEEFVQYTKSRNADTDFIRANFKLPEPADRNWYALRLGTSKARVELSINTKTNRIRTALYIKDTDVWNNLLGILENNNFNTREIVIDNESKTPSISVYKSIDKMDKGCFAQYDWFVKATVIMKKLLDKAL